MSQIIIIIYLMCFFFIIDAFDVSTNNYYETKLKCILLLL